MVIYLQIFFSSQPVLLRRRAVRRGTNAGPICWCRHTRTCRGAVRL